MKELNVVCKAKDIGAWVDWQIDCSRLSYKSRDSELYALANILLSGKGLLTWVPVVPLFVLGFCFVCLYYDIVFVWSKVQ